MLEQRRLLATFTVVNTADVGPGSLREAIDLANSNIGPDDIVFNIPTSDPGFVDVDSHLPGGDAAPDAFVIQPVAIPDSVDPNHALSVLTDDGTTIDGRSQSSFSGDTNPFGPEIVLDGSSNTLTAVGLLVHSSGNRVFGLNMVNFDGGAIFVNGEAAAGGDNNWFAANYLGTDATGTIPRDTTGSIGVVAGSGNIIGTNGDGVDDQDEGNLLGGVGLIFDSTHNVIAGNLIGTDRTGTEALGNGGGVGLLSAHFNVIGTNGDGVSDNLERNVISGNAGWNLRAEGAPNNDNVIAGNYIGVDITGTVALGGGENGGVDLVGSRNVIGTNGDGLSDDLERNIISGNDGDALHIRGPFNVDFENPIFPTLDNIVAGNYIGLDATGTVAIGNGNGMPGFPGNAGIVLDHGASFTRIGTNGDGVSDNLERNVIAGHLGSGIYVAHPITSDNVIAGNYIGTDATGTVALGNGESGILLQDRTHDNLVGTNSDGVADDDERNVIGANDAGVGVLGPDNVVAGNWIGVGATGGPIGNRIDGVAISGNRNRVGTDGDGLNDNAEANLVAYSGRKGIVVIGQGVQNSIRGNSIHSNGQLGIDLATFPFAPFDGVTPNDLGDADVGANEFQNFPTLLAVLAGSQTFAIGFLASAPNTVYTLDFYANSAADASGFGEGERFLGSAEVTTDGSGSVGFNVLISANTVGGEFITVTATDPLGNTSEFSGAFVATGLIGGTLITGGGPGSDTIGLTAGSVIVTVNGFDLGTFHPTEKIIVLGLAGDDIIQTDDAITLPVELFGGPGDDQLDGGSGPDLLDGGEGTNIIVSGPEDSVAGGPAIDSFLAPDFDNSGSEGVAFDVAGTFSDPNVGATHTATVDWGDGTSLEPLAVTDLGGTGSLAGSHAYVDGGLYKITVTLTASDGATHVLTTTAVITGVGLRPDGTLHIIGSSENDVVVVHRLVQHRLFVEATFLPPPLWFLPFGIKQFSAGDVDRIVSCLGHGNDVATIAGNVSSPAIIHGGTGNDILNSGSGPSVLIGGAGNDFLFGGGKRDILIGGLGKDVLFGSGNDDVLIGGSTTSDTNDTALLAVLSDWGSTTTYDDRVATIATSLSILDDDEEDMLIGSTGRDLFFSGIDDNLVDVNLDEDVL